MPSDALTIQAVNFTEVKNALVLAPALAHKYANTVMFRFSRRVARRVKVESLHGRPGIKGGPWARLKDKNVRGFSKGNSLGTLKSVVKASRIVRTHVEGATIRASGGMLTLSTKTGQAGRGTIFARVKSVTIPPRVHVVEPWNEEIPKTGEALREALRRAITVTLDKQMKSVTKALVG